MNKKLLLLIPLITAMVACSKDADEVLVERDIQSSTGEEAQVDDSNSSPEEVLELPGKALESDLVVFKRLGVPEVALTRALEFYSNNRASNGGLDDSSCLIKPMSETGEISKTSNRYDPTTLALLKQGIRNERFIMIVDFTQSNTKKRGYLLDMKLKTVKQMQIAHGYGSNNSTGIPGVFTNSANHGTTVSGFFISAVKTYPYSGHAASTGDYSSTGMRLYGLESTNNTAEKTSKVAHGAPYVTETKAGNSAGCPAMTITNSKTILKDLTGGILWYHHTKLNNSVSYKTPTCAKSTTLANK